MKILTFCAGGAARGRPARRRRAVPRAGAAGRRALARRLADAPRVRALKRSLADFCYNEFLYFCQTFDNIMRHFAKLHSQNFEWKVANIGACTAKTERRSCSTLAGTARPDPAMRFGSLPDEGGVRAAARRGLTSACRPAGPSRPPRTTRLSPPLFL